MTIQLDSFETELLHELRGVVAEQARYRLPEAHRRRRTRRVYGLVAGTAAAGAVTAVVLPGLLATPAFAVTSGPHGMVEVQVNRLEDASSLQRALAQHGVKADVRYLGEERKCASGRYRDAKSVPDSRTSFTVGTDGISVRIDRRDIAHGETVVIAASRIPHGVYGSVGIADGRVEPCRPLPITPSDYPR